MAKITRYDGNYLAFASSSTAVYRTIFGDTTQSDTLDANMITDYFLGWEKVTDSEFPPREWFNAVAYTISHTLAYTHQMGCPEWNTSQEYHTGSISIRSGSLYISQSDTNAGNDPATDTVNWEVVALISDLQNASSIIYDNVASGLSSTTVQGAIDELRDAANILYDDSLTSLGANVQAALDALATASTIPSGAVQYFAMSTSPTGWLEADGSIISRATYSGLFSAIGTLYGIGDGTTTFNIPDLRGQFIRGYDNGAGVDTGRVFGSGQDDALEEHSHYSGIGMQSGELAGYAGAGYTSNALSMTRRVDEQETNPAYNAITSGVIDSGTTVTGAKLGATSDANTPADETRPTNLAMLPCIKI